MSLKKNLLKNGFASTLQKGVRVLEQLILVPFFISAWGAEYYGEWLTLTIIPSVLAFSDLGFGTAAANTFVLRYASGDRQGAANMAKSGFWMISMLIGLGILISGIALIILNYFNIFEKSLVPAQDAIIAVSLMMAARLFNFFQQLYEAFFRAARKAAQSIHLTNINAMANIIGGFIVLKLGGNIVAFAATTFAVSALFNPTYAFIAKQELKLPELKSATIRKDDIIDALKKGIGYLMSPLWQAIYFQGTTFVVRLVLGPAAVAVFNTVRTLSRSANQLYSIINASMFPELQYEIGQGTWEKARKLFRTSLAITFLLAIAGMFFLFLFGLWFYSIWTNKALDPPVAMWNIFILGIGFNALWWTASVMFRAVNQPYRVSLAGLIASILSVGATWILSSAWGLTGAAGGVLVLDLLLAFYVLPVSCKMIDQNVKTMLKETLLDFREISNLQFKTLSNHKFFNN